MRPRSSARKRKKTRYLSLRRRLAAAASPSLMPSAASSPPSVYPLSPSHKDEHQRQHRLDLFPLHPNPSSLQPEDLHEDHLSRFFPSDESISLHTLLGSAISANSSSSAQYDDPISPSSSSANYSACSSSYGGGLAVAALRGREKWTAAEEDCDQPLSSASRRLSLKLDYDGILNAWKNQCPLYVDEEEAHQVVPDIRHAAAPLHYSPVFVDVSRCGRSAAGQWTVPDGGGEEKEADVGEDREARVMRYKEKRLRRLYNKRIRYEVRKLNAEKRPRLKGRFIRRDDD